MNRWIAASLMMISSAVLGQAALPRSVGKDLMTRDLPELAGKEAVVRANEYPPGTSNPPHRHNAHVFLHLLEGQLIVQVKGGQPVTLNPGDTYYESPNDIHVVSKNPSATMGAKALIFMVKDKGVPATTPVKE
jgi:quercetin dioxygenase-like cupin family protein